MTSFDVSAVGRQGILLGLSHPILAMKAAGKMFKALVSRGDYLNINQRVLNRPNAEAYNQSKLFLVDPKEYHLSKLEEAYQSRWAESIPGVAASQRAYVTFLNVLRADAFDAMKASLGSMTPEQGKALANYINVATGRGNLAGASGAAVSLNAAFFSPRLLVSRFEYLLGQPLAGGNAATRKLIAKEYARTALGAATALTLAGMAGAEIEKDPRSPDFLKMRFGDVRVDMLGGLVQAAVLMSRLVTGEKKTAKGEIVPLRGDKVPYAGDDAADVIWNFLRTKLSPALGASINAIAGRNVIGEKTTPVREALNTALPLTWREIYETMQKDGIGPAAAQGIIALLGLGVQNYETKEPQR
jgi:hypothetical protein